MFATACGGSDDDSSSSDSSSASDATESSSESSASEAAEEAEETEEAPAEEAEEAEETEAPIVQEQEESVLNQFLAEHSDGDLKQKLMESIQQHPLYLHLDSQ